MKVIFSDETIIIIEKPAGLLSVPGRGASKQDSVNSRVQETYPDALIVHRLDMATSGLMVLARGKTAHRKLSNQFERGQVQKSYIAIVHGLVSQETSEINAPLICDWPNRPKQMVDFDIGKPSQTQFKVISKGANTTRVELIPISGRTHQLRVHMLWVGHPICGDVLYNPDEYPRLMLHAQSLAFAHPETGAQMSFASVPDF
jgi:tRNA pseudouridine32 synthase/23S rRNA pseudouridine746 synthase